MAEVVPGFFASGSQVTRRASGAAAAKDISRAVAIWVGSSHVAGVMRDVAGLGSTVGHAPFDIIEPTKGWSNVEGSRSGPDC